ncbi:hypothetical protein Pta6605_24130 [Pseudomonas amygdali pv. tabaci]|nr:hypothetical protein Pta6605_24130 [Pseudomonas amygdali pv. tabaci]
MSAQDIVPSPEESAELSRRTRSATISQRDGRRARVILLAEISFDSSTRRASGVVDDEYKDKVITLDCPYGTVVILCDGEGQLKSIELS